jgi:hypothetical protein
MFGISRIRLLLLLLSVLNHTLFGDDSAIKLASSTPTYCIDQGILKIVKSRAEKCFAGGFVQSELTMLRNFSTADYHRSQELLAYQYFVENVDNIHRRSCDVADFEYIPLLPLSWRSGYPTSTSCTAGGYCPETSTPVGPTCSMNDLILDILSIEKYIKTFRGKNMNEGIPKFTVASTYNLRTVMAFGLGSGALRSGPVYTAITSFVTSISIGNLLMSIP